MGSFQQTLLLFLALAFAIAITPAFSVIDWDERYMPNPRLCLDQVNEANGCEREVYVSWVKKKINLSRDCCEAIHGLPYRCKIWIFNRRRFTSEFGNQVKGFCASLGITLPPSYRVYYPINNPSGQLGD
ncbi:hypothetical protein REPUB_Repub08aG0218400 [Reevesia pubescens]